MEDRRPCRAGGKRAADKPSQSADAVADSGGSACRRDLLRRWRRGALVRLRAVHGGGADRLARWTFRAAMVAAIGTRPLSRPDRRQAAGGRDPADADRVRATADRSSAA